MEYLFLLLGVSRHTSCIQDGAATEILLYNDFYHECRVLANTSNINPLPKINGTEGTYIPELAYCHYGCKHEKEKKW